MDKRTAKSKAYSERFIVADLRKMIAAARERGGVSRVNPQFQMHETCDIYDACLVPLKDTDVLPRDSHPGDVLRLTNILRDCVSEPS